MLFSILKPGHIRSHGCRINRNFLKNLIYILAIAVIFGAWLISLGEYELSFTLTGHNAKVYSVAILPNGDIVSGSADKYIKVWDYQEKKCIVTFFAGSIVYTVAVLPNGNVVSGSADKSIHIWDIQLLTTFILIYFV